MRILMLSQYFWPESFIINDVVRKLHAQGHQVTVATGKPNYPDGDIFTGYRAVGTQRECFEGQVKVLRVPLWPRGKGGAANLILNYLSFVLAGTFCLPWMLRGRQFDAILVFAPSPITQVIPAIVLKWLKKARLALWVQDLWPESLAATGFVNNPKLLGLVGMGVKAIYHFCDTLLVQSRAFIEPVARYGRRDKIHYYPNSMDVRMTEPQGALPATLQSVLDTYFCVVFAGNLGTAQALDTLVQAAQQLRGDADVRLVLVGSGSRLTWLKDTKAQLGLDNLLLPGRFPMELMPAIFERAGALLVSLTDEPAFAQTIPSKIQAYLAAGRPIIASMNGEGAKVVLEAGAGLASAAEQVEPLVANIRRLRAMHPQQRQAMGAAGRACFEAEFEMSTQVERLVELLQR